MELEELDNVSDDDAHLLSADDSDVDKDYLPDNNYDTDSHLENYEDVINNPPSNTLPLVPQTFRKRVRIVNEWKRVKTKKLRNEGKVYVDRKDKTHKNKKIVEYNHQCRYKCNINVPEDVRKEILNKYWETGDWELQSVFLNGAITLNPVSRKSANATKNKSVSCVYIIGEFRVCQEFFKKTLFIQQKDSKYFLQKFLYAPKHC